MDTKEVYQKIKSGRCTIHELLKFIQERELMAFDRGFNLAKIKENERNENGF